MDRPRKKGEQLATLAQVLADQATHWTTLRVAHWYSTGERNVEMVSATCVWYHSGMPPVPIRYVLLRDPLGKFSPQALLCTDVSADPATIVSWFVLRWQLETTFQEVRRHRGLETQRQWNDLAIARTTPVLLGLFSLVTLLADEKASEKALWVRCAACVKCVPTFADALAAVRRPMWEAQGFCGSGPKADIQKLSQTWRESFVESLCYAN